MSEMLKELAKVKSEAANIAAGVKSESEELPEGASPLEARAEDAEESEEVAEEASVSDESESSDDGADGEHAEVAAAQPGKKIKIGDREFESEADAIEYAKELNDRAEKSELYNQAVRDTLEQIQSKEPKEAAPEVNEEEEFYANPTEKLKKIREQATQDALKQFHAHNEREKLWSQFLNDYPDIRRKDAERILQENMATIGRMTDYGAAMKKLAARVREEYDEIRGLTKPRTVIDTSKRPAQAPSGGQKKSVTPAKTQEKSLSMAEQLRSIKK